jgi:hypothetical protein
MLMIFLGFNAGLPSKSSVVAGFGLRLHRLENLCHRFPVTW